MLYRVQFLVAVPPYNGGEEAWFTWRVASELVRRGVVTALEPIPATEPPPDPAPSYVTAPEAEPAAAQVLAGAPAPAPAGPVPEGAALEGGSPEGEASPPAAAAPLAASIGSRGGFLLS